MTIYLYWIKLGAELFFGTTHLTRVIIFITPQIENFWVKLFQIFVIIRGWRSPILLFLFIQY